MATQWLNRVLLAIPAAQRATYNAWWANNIDTDGAGNRTFTAGLNATGLSTDPVTYYVANTALTNQQLRKIIVRLCALAGLTIPADWDTYTRQQKRQWLAANWPTIRQRTGVRAMVLDDNDGAWSDYTAAITAEGLKPIRTPIN